MSPMIRRSGARRRISERFDEAKLHSSLSEACNSVGVPEGAVDDIVTRTLDATKQWLSTKTEITDNDIRRKAGDTLESLCPEAGYLYKHQKSIL